MFVFFLKPLQEKERKIIHIIRLLMQVVFAHAIIQVCSWC